MIGTLPTALHIGSRDHPIRTDFRDILHIFSAFSDNTLTDAEKAEVCIRCLFLHPEELTQDDLQEAVQKAFWFCDGGDAPKPKTGGSRLLDWKHDESVLFPAVSKAAGFEVRSCDYLHWWVFLGYFGEIGEGLFSTVVRIRQKLSAGKPLAEWEQEFYKRNQELVLLRTEEDRAAIAETEAFLDEIL